MTINGKACIAGICEHPPRKADDKSPPRLHAEVAPGALEDAGLTSLKRPPVRVLGAGEAPKHHPPVVMTVLAPCPAAAWAKASPIRSSGKRAVTSRLTPSLGMRARVRRKAVPRP